MKEKIKKILRDMELCNGFYDFIIGPNESRLLVNYIKQLKQENKQLQEELEEYQKALDETTSEKIDIEDNWNKLKEYLHNQIPTDKTVLTKHIKIFEVLDKMQKIEGSDSNE